jgi:RNA polymerase sigma-70 factor (ECF subfamily)
MSTSEFNQLLINNIEYIKTYSVFYTRNEESAKDLLQETLFRALANQEKYRNDTNLRGWLLTIMRNIFINNYRREKKEKRIFNSSFFEFSENRAGAGTVHGDVNLGEKEILAVVRRLPNKIRIPFCLQCEGYKYHEIAEIFDIAEGTVKSRIHLARKLLIKKIS